MSWVLRGCEAGRQRERLEEWKATPRTEERTEERHQDTHMLNTEIDEDKVGMRSEGPDPLLGHVDKSQHVAERSPDTSGPDGWGDGLGLDGGSEN